MGIACYVPTNRVKVDFHVTPGGFREVRDSLRVAPTQTPGGRITLNLREVKINAKGRNELRPYKGRGKSQGIYPRTISRPTRFDILSSSDHRLQGAQKLREEELLVPHHDNSYRT